LCGPTGTDKFEKEIKLDNNRLEKEREVLLTEIISIGTSLWCKQSKEGVEEKQEKERGRIPKQTKEPERKRRRTNCFPVLAMCALGRASR